MRLPVNRNLPLAALILLSACGGGASVRDVPPPAANGPAADYPMVIGAPFVIDGVTYSPSDTMNYDAVGIATVGPDGGGAISAAHRTLPLPSYVEVTALGTGKTVLVRIERRGPMTGSGLIELSPGAAAQLGLAAIAKPGVRVRRVNPPEMERAALRQGQQAPDRMDTPKSLLAVLQRKLDQQMGIVAPPVVEPQAVAKPDASTEQAKPSTTPTVTPTLPKSGAKAVTKPASRYEVPPKVTPAAPAVKTNPEAKPQVKPKPETQPNVQPAAAAEARGSYFVQIGAFSSKANAEAAAKKAGGAVSQSGKLWRVRLGPFADADKAGPALAKARSAGYSDARIQRAN
ncbi:MAG: SPOR domain-containing protein [Proteobacteria bacterium]|nr:SPOR domain-containing protein [Pseudomonadota bacterium]